ncbi:16764_t:CDS:2, partial [Dentiscutata erythropus]
SCYDEIITLSPLSPLLSSWHDLDNLWAGTFLKAAKNFLDTNTFVTLKEKVESERVGNGLKGYWKKLIKNRKDKENLAPSTITGNYNKEKNEFSGIDADKLKLWKVEIPDEDENMINGLTFHDHDTVYYCQLDEYVNTLMNLERNIFISS